MCILVSDKLTSTQLSQFKFSPITNRMTKGIMLLPLAMSIVYVAHLTHQAIVTNDCKGSSEPEIIKCVSSLARLWGGLTGGLVGITVGSLVSFTFSKIKPNQEAPTKPTYQPKEKVIFIIANVRRNILFKKAKLERDLKNNSDEKQKIISKELEDLTAWNVELEKEQRKLWKEIEEPENIKNQISLPDSV